MYIYICTACIYIYLREREWVCGDMYIFHSFTHFLLFNILLKLFNCSLRRAPMSSLLRILAHAIPIKYSVIIIEGKPY